MFGFLPILQENAPVRGEFTTPELAKAIIERLTTFSADDDNACRSV